jgi:hypothetical protein
MLLLGPNKIIGDIYSSGWNHLYEIFENKVELVPIKNPDIISGTIEWQGRIYQIIYNEFECNELTHSDIDYRLVYIPKEGYTATIILYMNPNIFIRLDTNTIFFTTSIRIAGRDEIFQAKITLQMTTESIKQIEDKFGIEMLKSIK